MNGRVAESAASDFAGLDPTATYSGFDETRFCFHTLEMYSITTTEYFPVPLDGVSENQLPPELRSTRTHTRILFHFVGDRSESWWRFRYADRPFIEVPADGTGGGFQVVGTELEESDSNLPILRVDFRDHRFRSRNQNAPGSWSILFDFRYSAPAVIAYLGWERLAEPLQESLKIYPDSPECLFSVFSCSEICLDKELQQLQWVNQGCSQ
jgi:hypothetical protein